MILSSYTAKIATWVYNNTTTHTTSILPTNYLTNLTNFNWIASIVSLDYTMEFNLLLQLVYLFIFVNLVLILTTMFSSNNSAPSTINSGVTFLQILEDELGSGTKLLYVYTTLFGYIVWFFLYSYLGFSLPWIVGLLPLYGTLLVFLLFGIPLMLLLNYRAFFMTYIRGNVGLKPLLFELILDYINLIAFFLRFNIQLIRIIIITAIFFLYNELFEEFIYPNYDLNLTLNISITNLILIFANMIYEVGHFWIIFGMQSSATLFILTILFQFLYTQVFFNKFQFVFNTKRYIK